MHIESCQCYLQPFLVRHLLSSKIFFEDFQTSNLLLTYNVIILQFVVIQDVATECNIHTFRFKLQQRLFIVELLPIFREYISSFDTTRGFDGKFEAILLTRGSICT